MAILNQGLIGTFTGKMGSIVIAKWKDSYVGRGKPKKSNKPGTETQLIQRSKFKLIGEFLSPLSDTVLVGFKGTKNTTSMNEAMRYNLNHAVSGIYPEYTLNYPKLSFSDHKGRGRIGHVVDPVLLPVAGHAIKFSWALDNVPEGNTKLTDLIYIVCYHPLNDRYRINEVVRNTLASEIVLSKSFIGEVHTWIFVASDDKKFATYTQYLGKVTVIA